jgi:hypothetical protein
VSRTLADAVGRFVTVVGQDLAALVASRGLDTGRVRADVEVEVAELVAAFIDADAVHTDAELDAYLRVVGPTRAGHLARATPDGLRRAGVLNGKRALLGHPSRLFSVLLEADRLEQTSGSAGARTWRYLAEATAVGQAVASLDLHATPTELDAITRLRTTLLGAMQQAGVQHPAVRRPDGGFFAAPASAPAAAVPAAASSGSPSGTSASGNGGVAAPPSSVFLPPAPRPDTAELAAVHRRMGDEPGGDAADDPPARPTQEVLRELEG